MVLRRVIIIRITFVLLRSTGAGCAAKVEAAAKAKPQPPRVQTVEVRQGTIWPSLQIAGVIACCRQVAVTANLSEPISEVDVLERQHVRAGRSRSP